jgi:UDPglucose 6-dehydrogenase
MKIGIIGLWHQGVVAAGCFAKLGVEVLAADRDAKTIEALQAGRAPLFEPELDELLQEQIRSGRLQFTTDLAACVRERPYVLLMFDTPVNEQDESNLTDVFAAVDAIAPHLGEYTVVTVTAQVPVGTCDEVKRRIHEARPGLHFDVVYIPENLRLGVAIERFLKPALPVMGADDPVTLDRAIALWGLVTPSWFRVSLRTAEMTKHALNAFLATSISFANEIGNLCDETGADAMKVAEALRLEPRIGPKAMLFPGLGFSGGTLARDMQTLRKIGHERGLQTPLLDGVWMANLRQNGMVVRKLKKIFSSLAERRVAVLGLTYKPGTSTLRRSVAQEIIADLVREGAVVTATDPRADRQELQTLHGFLFCESAQEALRDADAAVLITPWPEFRALPWSELRRVMRGDVLVDAANHLDPSALTAAGFRYRGIGRGMG